MDRSKFLSQAKPEIKAVSVDWSDEPVFVRRIPAAAYRVGIGSNMNGLDFILLCVCDGDGKRLFNDGDREMLEELEFAKIQPILQAALEFNNLGPESVEEIAGN
jgi:hypothetical protein